MNKVLRYDGRWIEWKGSGVYFLVTDGYWKRAESLEEVERNMKRGWEPHYLVVEDLEGDPETNKLLIKASKDFDQPLKPEM